MNKTAVLITIIIVGGLFIGIQLWTSNNRFNIVQGSNGAVYEVDRKTGNTWHLTGPRKTLQETPNPVIKREERQLPLEEQRKITGNAGLSSYTSGFAGKIYNGSDWTVTRVIINVTGEEKDGSIRWQRDYSERVFIAPLSTSVISFDLTGSKGLSKAPWIIKKVFGHK